MKEIILSVTLQCWRPIKATAESMCFLSSDYLHKFDNYCCHMHCELLTLGFISAWKGYVEIHETEQTEKQDTMSAH